jgi:pyruvate-ferredoxin/flavodoxin oxidoreductase
VSHLRFGPNPLEKPYLIQRANFVGIHQWGFLERLPMLHLAEEGATVLINTPYPKEEVWDRLPRPVQEEILKKKLKVYVINAYELARQVGLPGRINTIMQAAFFKLSGVLPEEEAKARIKKGIEKSYGKRGRSVLEKNFQAVELGFGAVEPLPIPGRITSDKELIPPMVGEAPPFVRDVLGPIALGLGDSLPVSLFPADGTYPTGTARYEKRGIAEFVPTWDPEVCVQCGKCVLVCPHAVIRAKVVPEEALAGAPEGFPHRKAMWKELSGEFTIAISADDCTGCSLCVEACPAKDKRNPSRKALNMAPRLEVREALNRDWDFFLSLPETPRAGLKLHTVKDVQLLPPLFEFPGACAGCGETPYLRLLSQLFGDRLIVANATGCSSIYGGNLPTTPWSKNKEGRGPAWANSLFEDNAEFGLGMRLALDKKAEYARRLLPEFREVLGEGLVARLLEEVGPEALEERRKDVALLREKLASLEDPKGQGPPGGGRGPHPPLGLDRGRRRLGLRHRLRGPGPRPGQRGQGQGPGAGHRGLLQHRGPGLQGHGPGGHRQVRHRGQDQPQEGPGLHGHELRPRLRGPGGHGGGRRPHREDLPRGRGPPRPRPHHRLQPLHRPRH